jgi:hypothetical protein
MSIHSEKLEIVKLILETDNPDILKSIKKFFIRANRSDFWEKLSTEQKAEIEQGILESKNGKTIDFDDFMKKHRK